MIKKLWNWIKSLNTTDPVYHCEVYKEIGCVHIDGYLCDLETCTMRLHYDTWKRYKINLN